MRPVHSKSALKQILNRDFNTVTAINFFVLLAYYQILVVSASYAQEHFGASLSTAGLTAGIMVIFCLISRFLSGNFISIFGGKIVLIFGTVLYLSAAVLSFFVDNLGILFVQRAVAGFAMGVTGTATGSIMACAVPPAVQGLGVSLFSLSTAIALAIGPFFGISVTSLFGFEMLYTEVLCMAGFCLLLSLTVRASNMARAAHRRSMLKLDSYIDVRVLKFATIVFLVPLGYGCLTAYLANFSAERGLGAAASIFFLAYGGATVISRPLTGRLFDLYGENLIIYPTIILTSLTLFLVSISTSVWMIILAGLLQGFGFGNFTSAGQALALKLVRKYRFPQATSTYFIFFDLGIGTAPYIFGFVAAQWGFASMYQTLAAITLLAAVGYYLVHGRSHPLKRPLRRHA